MFTAFIETEIAISVPPKAVWAVLIDFETYPVWNPFIRRIEGRPISGEFLRTELKSSPDASPMRFSPRVLAAEPARELRWLGRLGIPGLFDGEHSFCLSPTLAGGTKFYHSERFSGLLVPVFRSKILTDTASAFVAMNEALKARVEALADLAFQGG